MRIFLLLLLSSTAYAQKFNIQRVVYSLLPAEQSSWLWEKGVPYTNSFEVDTVKGLLVVPKVQLNQTKYTMKDLVAEKVVATWYDTSYVISGRDSLELVPPYIVRKSSDSWLLFTKKRINAVIIQGSLYLIYPKRQKHIRCVQYGKN